MVHRDVVFDFGKVNVFGDLLEKVNDDRILSAGGLARNAFVLRCHGSG